MVRHQDRWAWNSAYASDRTPVPPLREAIYGTYREIEVERGLLERAASLVHDQAVKERPAMQAMPENAPTRRRPGI